MRTRSRFLRAASLLLLFLLAACREQEQIEVPGTCDFTGITPTDEAGTQLGPDTDDWCKGDSAHAALLPAFPNPSIGGAVTLRYDLPASASVRLILIGPDCSIVRRLLNPTQQEAGSYRIAWDGADDQGNPVPEGIYRCQLSVNGVFACHGDIQIVAALAAAGDLRPRAGPRRGTAG